MKIKFDKGRLDDGSRMWTLFIGRNYEGEWSFQAGWGTRWLIVDFK